MTAPQIKLGANIEDIGPGHVWVVRLDDQADDLLLFESHTDAIEYCDAHGMEPEIDATEMPIVLANSPVAHDLIAEGTWA